jgi:hypothetical protein
MPEGKRPLETLSVDVRKILKWIINKQKGGVEGVHLSHDKDKGRVPVSAVLNCVRITVKYFVVSLSRQWGMLQ